MKSVYFHIGYHRTGTTFFQTMVSRNRERLREFGCLVPRTGYDGKTHAPLALSLPSKRDEYICEMRSGAVLEEAAESGPAIDPARLYRSLRAELASESFRTALISSECFLEWLDVRALSENLGRDVADVQIVVLLRRQDRWIESVYSQVIKDPQLAYAADFQSLPQHNLLNFESVLQPWIKHFGANNLHVIFYQERMQPLQTSREILGRLGVEGVLEGAGRSPRKLSFENSSLDECCVEIIRLLNARQPASASIRAFLGIQSRQFESEGLFRKWRLPEQDATRLMSLHAESNARLFDRLGVAPDSTWGDISRNEFSNAELKERKFETLLSELANFLDSSTYSFLRTKLAHSIAQ